MTQVAAPLSPAQSAEMSLAVANRKYFDTIGDSYDSKPWWAKVNQQVTDDVRSHLDWLEIPLANTGSKTDVKEVRLLDYACGPGLMSRIFAPYVTTTTGIDISPNMIATYNARARSAHLPISVTNGHVGDLLASPPMPELSGPDFHSYDLAAVGFGFHHFEDVIHAARSLKARLRPGGVMVISEFLEGGDLMADEEGNPVEGSGAGSVHRHHGNGHGHGHGHGHSHGHRDHGKVELPESPHTPTIRKGGGAVIKPDFTIEGVKEFFTEAGFVDVDVRVMNEKAYMEFAGKMWRTVLFAKGKRPVEDGGKSEL